MTWWRWLILMLIIAASLWVDRQVEEWRYPQPLFFEALSYGCYYGQLFALAALAVLLPGKPLLRLAVVGALATVVWYLAVLNWDYYQGTWFALVHWGVVAADVALFIVVKRWLNVRMDWPGPDAARERYQFSMGEMLIVTAISAFLLWLGRRWLEPTEVTIDDVWEAGTWLLVHVPLHWAVAVPAMITVWKVPKILTMLPYVLMTGHAYVALLGATTACLLALTGIHTSLVEWVSYLLAQALYVFVLFLLLRLLGFRCQRCQAEP